MNIKRLKAKITRVTTLSPSAREVTLTLPEPLGFMPGAFVNVFLTDAGQRLRRAYSISSEEEKQDEITLSIRKGSTGGMSERFWNEDVAAMPVEIMGPLGLNTVDKITSAKVFLFAFGIGVSVIKGLLPHLLRRSDLQEVTIVTGSRNEEEVLYKDYFEQCAASDPRVRLRFVISQPADQDYPFRGHLQDYVQDLDCTDATVYLCGTNAACQSLKETLETQSKPSQFLIEAFD